MSIDRPGLLLFGLAAPWILWALRRRMGPETAVVRSLLPWAGAPRSKEPARRAWAWPPGAWPLATGALLGALAASGVRGPVPASLTIVVDVSASMDHRRPAMRVSLERRLKDVARVSWRFAGAADGELGPVMHGRPAGLMSALAAVGPGGPLDEDVFRDACVRAGVVVAVTDTDALPAGVERLDAGPGAAGNSGWVAARFSLAPDGSGVVLEAQLSADADPAAIRIEIDGATGEGLVAEHEWVRWTVPGTARRVTLQLPTGDGFPADDTVTFLSSPAPSFRVEESMDSAVLTAAFTAAGGRRAAEDADLVVRTAGKGAWSDPVELGVEDTITAGLAESRGASARTRFVPVQGPRDLPVLRRLAGPVAAVLRPPAASPDPWILDWGLSTEEAGTLASHPVLPVAAAAVLEAVGAAERRVIGLLSATESASAARSAGPLAATPVTDGRAPRGSSWSRLGAAAAAACAFWGLFRLRVRG